MESLDQHEQTYLFDVAATRELNAFIDIDSMYHV